MLEHFLEMSQNIAPHDHNILSALKLATQVVQINFYIFKHRDLNYFKSNCIE